MNETRSFASLEPSLLARKGGAKPAMRPQIGPAIQPLAPIEDLGWNDMGEAEVEPEAQRHAKPAVRQHLEAIAAHLARAGSNDKADLHRRSAPAKQADGRRAAFTLRLDSERHLKLRLASTIKNRSAQQIVTEALDRLLGDIPELESLTSQLRTKR